MMKKAIFLTLTFISISIITFSQVYQWRGEGRKGIYDGTGLMTEWPENGPKMLWSKVDLPTGYSSPSIAYETIFLTGVRDESDVLTAFDMEGNIKWQTVYGRAWLQNYPASRCTPTIDNNKVYVTSGMGEVACLDAMSGNIVWKVDAHGMFEGPYDMWGLAESVLIQDNKVFCTPGGKKTTMIALDKSNGSVIWASESIGEPPSYTSPLMIEWNGKRLIATLTQNYLIGVDPDNGHILWKFDYRDYADKKAYDNHATTPLFENGSIYITSGYNRKGVKLKLAENLASVSVEWTNDVLDSQHGGVVKIGNYIYGSSWETNTTGKWACIDWNTGETLYEKQWLNKGQVIAAGDYLYCYDEKVGDVALVKADPSDFKVTSSFKVTLGQRGPFWAHPVINDGILYVRHEDAFMAYSIRKK